MCGNDQDKLNIHHNCYDHRGYEEFFPEDLVCLCEKCHSKYHSYDKLVERNNELEKENSDLFFDNQMLKLNCSTLDNLNKMMDKEWEQDKRTKMLYDVIDELKEERDYIQQKFDLWRENRKKDIEYLINIDNNDFDDELPF